MMGMDIYTNPVSVRTSLVIMTVFLQPWHNSSRVHSIFFSIGGGFNLPDELEYIIGVPLLRQLAFLDCIREGIVKLPLILLFNEEGVGIKLSELPTLLLLFCMFLFPLLIVLFLDVEGKREMSKLLYLPKQHPNLELIIRSSSLDASPFNPMLSIPFVFLPDLSSTTGSWWIIKITLRTLFRFSLCIHASNFYKNGQSSNWMWNETNNDNIFCY